MDKFMLPKERLPRPFRQNIYKGGKLYSSVGSCVACTFTRILEVINYLKTDTYVNLSVGYMYGRHNRKDKQGGGMNERLVLDELMQSGTVPESMCSDYCEFPEIKNILESRADLAELDEAAREYKINGWTDISGSGFKARFEYIKKYLTVYGLPLAGRTRKCGENHECLIVGFDGDYILWLDHDGTDKIHSSKYDKFTAAFFIDGGTGEMDNFRIFTSAELRAWLAAQSVSRKITTVQLHHTYSPSYKDFNGSNHAKLQSGMKSYHVKSRGFSDIAQHFTIFPDGKVMTGRSLDRAAAGIIGCNAGGICIECLGNFDTGGDTMTAAQKAAIAETVKILLDRFHLTADNVTYHAWWTAKGQPLGDYIKGKSAKTCPGTSFFGGNTRAAHEKNLRPMIESKGENVLKKVESINDIVWELTNAGIITDGKLWMQKCAEDKNVYWLCYKMANKLRGTL